MRKLFATVLHALGRPDLALGLEKDASYSRALANERSRILEAPMSRDVAYDGARRRLDGPQALTFGTLPNGDAVRVRRSLALMSALVLGATGAGKTRFLLSLLLEPLRQIIEDLRVDAHAHHDVSVELELIDPKFETFDLFRKYFNREIAAKSMLPNATALTLIEQWEADVVDKSSVPPAAAPKKAKATIKSIVDLKKLLMPEDEP